METRAHYVLIGAFCLLTFLVGLVFVVWVNKTQLDLAFAEYDVVFDEAVTGLAVGSRVQFHGIQVGEVRKLRLANDDPRKVLAHVRIQGDTPIRQDTRAKLVYSGLTGVATIQLIAGDPKSAILLAIPPEKYPLIQSVPSDLGKLMSSGAEMIGGFDQALARLSALLNDKNLKLVENTLAHIETISGAFAKQDDAIQRSLADAPNSLASLREAAKAIAKLSAHTDARISAITSVDMARVSEQIKQTLSSLQTSLQSFDELAKSANSNLRTVDRQTLPQMADLLQQTNALAIELRRLLLRAERSPRSILLGAEKVQPEVRQ
jgi:phospholipid/cholesterol/gamma-HCH transport system substrate-binding protein